MAKSSKIIIVFCFVLLLLSSCTSVAEQQSSIRIGYFPNLTHIPTIIALEQGYFAEEFGSTYLIETKVVNNGSLFMEALMTDAIDVGTVGPAPAIIFYDRHPIFRIVAGAVNGGTLLMVRVDSQITSVSQLANKKVAIPVIGGTQDVMLRQVLEQAELAPTTSGGNVQLVKASSADMVTLFRQKAIDAAIVQQPWGDYLQSQVNGQVLLDWNQFVWGEDVVNTVVVATDDFIAEADKLEQYLAAHNRALQFIANNKEQSLQLVHDHFRTILGTEVPVEQLAAAFDTMEITSAVNEQVIQDLAHISQKANYIKEIDISGLIDLSGNK